MASPPAPCATTQTAPEDPVSGARPARPRHTVVATITGSNDQPSNLGGVRRLPPRRRTDTGWTPSKDPSARDATRFVSQAKRSSRQSEQRRRDPSELAGLSLQSLPCYFGRGPSVASTKVMTSPALQMTRRPATFLHWLALLAFFAEWPCHAGPYSD